MQSSFDFLPFLYKILFSQNFTSCLHSNLKDIKMKNRFKIMISFTASPSKKRDFELFPRSFSFAPRSFQVCFGSDLRPRCASVGFILRSLFIFRFFKYTKVVFNLLHNFVLPILIHVFSVVQAVPCAFCVADSPRRTSAVADHSVTFFAINYKLSTINQTSVHNLFGRRYLNKPGEINCLLTLSINSFHKLNSFKSWVF